VDRHVNRERDVALIVIEGDGTLVIDSSEHAVGVGSVALVPSGLERAVRAGSGGIRYVTAHLRRAPGIDLG